MAFSELRGFLVSEECPEGREAGSVFSVTSSASPGEGRIYFFDTDRRVPGGVSMVIGKDGHAPGTRARTRYPWCAFPSASWQAPRCRPGLRHPQSHSRHLVTPRPLRPPRHGATPGFGFHGPLLARLRGRGRTCATSSACADTQKCPPVLTRRAAPALHRHRLRGI